MKKQLLFLVACGFLASCAAGHEHTYSGEWASDATNHWHAATCEHTDEKSDSAAHTFGDWSEKTAPTYDAAGVDHRTCSVCNFEETRAGAAKLNHNFATEWTNDASKHWHACTDAGYANLKKDEGNHVPGEWNVTKQATFTEKGSKEKRCTVCNAVVATEEITEKAHNYATEWTTNETNHWHACTDAGYTDLKSNDAAHTAGDWVVTKEATFTETGSKQKSCTVCNKVLETEEIAVKEHSYSNAWSSDANKHWHACTDVGFDLKTDEDDHTFGEYEVTKNATIISEGVETKTCSVCNYKENRSIAKLTPTSLDTDGIFNGASIANANNSGINMLTNGFYAIGSDGKQLNIDSSGGNIVTGGKSTAGSRFFLLKTDGAAKITLTASAGKTNTTCTFGFISDIPGDSDVTFVGTTHTSSTTSTAKYDFSVSEAGTYYIGADATFKLKSIEVELHEVDTSVWATDETNHWHGTGVEGCALKQDLGAHNFGEWVTVKEPTETETGLDQRTCQTCNYVESVTTNCHTYATTYSSDANGHWYACIDEGYENLKKSEEAHTFGDPAYSTENNEVTYTCAKCGYEKISHKALYTPFDSTAEDQVDGMSASGDAFVVNDSSTAIVCKKSNFVEHEMESAITLLDGSTPTFGNAITFTDSAANASSIKITVPAACKVYFYAYNGGAGNFRFSTTSDCKAGTYIKISGETNLVADLMGVYSTDIEEAGNYYFACSSKAMATSSYLYAIEFVY